MALNPDTYKEQGALTDEELKTIAYIFHFRSLSGPPNGNVLIERSKISGKGGATVVILTDGAYGIAVCSRKENYCKRSGVRMALDRAYNPHMLGDEHNNWWATGYVDWPGERWQVRRIAYGLAWSAAMARFGFPVYMTMRAGSKENT